MGLNVSNNQIAEQLDLNRSDVQQMTYLFREGIVKKTKVIFQNKVEFDEVYIVSGHKGHPEAVGWEAVLIIRLRPANRVEKCLKMLTYCIYA